MQQQPTLVNRILYSTPVKILIGFMLCVFIIAICQSFIPRIITGLFRNENASIVVTGIITSAIVIYAYRRLYSKYEKRVISELSLKNLLSNICAGVLLGFIYQSLVILCIYLNNSYTIVAINGIGGLLPYFIISVNAAITEEIIFRGIIFRLTEEKTGSYIALLISAAIFGGVHLMNENSTPLAAAAIAIEAGLLLGAAYIYTRNLWFPIAIHFAWNFAQSGIYGASTSGFAMKNGLITANIHGRTLLTGGLFGPEASAQAMIIGLLLSVLLLIISIRKGKIIQPRLKKNKVS